MDFTKREMMIIELALVQRSNFLSDHMRVVPDAERKQSECNALIDKIRSN